MVAGDEITLTVLQPDGNQAFVNADVPLVDIFPVVVTIDNIDTPINGDYIVRNVTDAAGNESAASNHTVYARHFRRAASTPVISISEAEPNGLVDQTEAQDGVKFKLICRIIFSPTILSLVVTQPDGTELNLEFTVPADWNGTDDVSRCNCGW